MNVCILCKKQFRNSADLQRHNLNSKGCINNFEIGKMLADTKRENEALRNSITELQKLREGGNNEGTQNAEKLRELRELCETQNTELQKLREKMPRWDEFTIDDLLKTIWIQEQENKRLKDKLNYTYSKWKTREQASRKN
jgi:hypothetical protein